VRADEKLSASLELERAIRAVTPVNQDNLIASGQRLAASPGYTWRFLRVEGLALRLRCFGEAFLTGSEEAAYRCCRSFFSRRYSRNFL
jgi:hypothetical protein